MDAGLKDELVFGDPEAPRFVFWEGRLRPVPGGPAVRRVLRRPAWCTLSTQPHPTAMLTGVAGAQDLPVFDLMSIVGKIRAGLGAMGIRPPPPGYEESVEAFVRRNLVCCWCTDANQLRHRSLTTGTHRVLKCLSASSSLFAAACMRVTRPSCR